MSSNPPPANYQMYRRVKRPGMCCVVVDGAPFPKELDPDDWAIAEYLDERDPRPPGFDDDVAAFACATWGFYIFQWLGRRSKS